MPRVPVVSDVARRVSDVLNPEEEPVQDTELPEPKEPEAAEPPVRPDEKKEEKEPKKKGGGKRRDVGPTGKGRTDTTNVLQPLTEATVTDWLGSNKEPDVMLSIPNIGIDHIGIEVDDLRADVTLHAKVMDLIELDVGARVSIETVQIDIENVRIQAMLKVDLEAVHKIIDRVMTSIDNNPEILTSLTGGLGRGLEGALSPHDAIEAKADVHKEKEDTDTH